MKPLILATLLCFALSACRKETDVTPSPELFPLEYYFVNATASPLRGVNLTTYTYFPDIDKTTIYYKHFSPVQARDSLLIRVDTATITKSWGYAGCQTQFEVNVIERRPGAMLYVSTWLTERSLVSGKADARTYFQWPGDTLKAVKTKGYFVKEIMTGPLSRSSYALTSAVTQAQRSRRN